MALPDLSVLNRYKTAGWPPDYPANVRSFFSPVDQVHQVLVDLVRSATSSLVVGMFGFNDDGLADLLLEKLADEHVHVQLTLDASQAKGLHEHQILGREQYPASSIAIGHSEHGQIQHLKLMVVDGLDRVSGSTNWSHSGESLQDNELTVIRDRAMAAEARSRLDAIHAHMLHASRAGMP